MAKKNQAQMNKYRNAIYKCCWPDCKFGYGFQTHHIIPLSKGGTDTYDNYIVLCAQCHNMKGLHSKHSNRQLQLLTYKFYVEKMIFGVSSENPKFDSALSAFILKQKDKST